MSDIEKEKSIFYPPGGILIWIIILVEIATFFMGIGALLHEKRKALEEFYKMQSSLHLNYGLWNTIFLITSGFFMALAVNFHKDNQTSALGYSLVAAILFGLCFLFLKGFEYNEKLNIGQTIHSGDFFSFYWLLTGFHFVHVIAGTAILSFIFLYRKTISLENLEAGASFWHMCDLIWVVLFPVLYLIR